MYYFDLIQMQCVSVKITTLLERSLAVYHGFHAKIFSWAFHCSCHAMKLEFYWRKV